MVDKDWFEWHKLHWTELTATQADAAAAALIGLTQYDLGPLAELLKMPTQVLPTEVRRALVDAIEGGKNASPLRLSAKRHPDYARNEHDALQKIEKRREELLIAKYVEAQGGLIKGQHEAAIMAAGAKFGRSRSHIERIWSRHLRSPWKGRTKEFDEKMITHILMSDD